jgi:hypothetical protein
MTEPAEQAIIDREHLRLLRLGYLISAALSALFAPLGLVYGFMGTELEIMMQQASPSGAPALPHPEFFGRIFLLLGFGFTAIMLGLAILKLRVAWCLKRRRSPVFCLVVAAISCLAIPYGTLLGILTFAVLDRRSVSQLFGGSTAKT